MTILDDIKFAASVVKLIDAVYTYFQRQIWYQQGRAEADAEANAEQIKRIADANAARADDDAFATGELHDPRERPD